jgi:hypothetical protein
LRRGVMLLLARALRLLAFGEFLVRLREQEETVGSGIGSVGRARGVVVTVVVFLAIRLLVLLLLMAAVRAVIRGDVRD